MIHFIKKELIIFIISLSIFGGVIYIYQNQGTNINAQKEQAQDLKQQISSEKRKLRKIIQNFKKEKLFEQNVIKANNLKIIQPYNYTFKIFDIRKKFKEELSLLFGKNFRFLIKTTPKQTTFHKYVIYPVEIQLTYLNADSIKKFFDWLNSNFVYSLKSLKYNASIGNGVFQIKIDLLGEKSKNSSFHSYRFRRF